MGFAVGEVAFLEFIAVVYLRGSILVFFGKLSGCICLRYSACVGRYVGRVDIGG